MEVSLWNTCGIATARNGRGARIDRAASARCIGAVPLAGWKCFAKSSSGKIHVEDRSAKRARRRTTTSSNFESKHPYRAGSTSVAKVVNINGRLTSTERKVSDDAPELRGQ